MAMGKYSRVDGRRSSNYCSTIAIVVFVGVCLVGVWMMMSSSIVPIQNSDLVSDDTPHEVQKKIDDNDSTQFEDSSGNFPLDAAKGESNTDNSQDESDTGNSQGGSNIDAQDNQTLPDKGSENTVEENQEATIKESSKDRTENEEEPKIHREQNSGDGEQNAGDGELNSETGETKTEGSETNEAEQRGSEESTDENKSDSNEDEKKSDTNENSVDIALENKADSQNEEEKVEQNQEENVERNQEDNSEQSAGEEHIEIQAKDQASNEVFPAGAQSEILNESNTGNGAWSTQMVESKNEKESLESTISKPNGYGWKLCNVTAGPDYIPCLDNVQAIRRLPSTKHYEHRERHCPDEAPTCLVPLPGGYKRPVQWPTSREKIWFNNVPHTKLAVVKGHQNWVKVTGEYLTFPGGGTQFTHGALHYIDYIQKTLPDIAWGKQSRVILDVGCGVASFGGYIFERDVLAMSFAPKDEHEAQVQFALERGIPAISAVMGTTRLPFPSRVFDVVHCARCRVPWHIEGGKLLLELNRVLRPGGYFVWSATPVYRKVPEDVGIWNAMSELTKKICWDLVAISKDSLNGIGAAIYRKPTSNECYEKRLRNEPPLCEESDNADAAWNIPLQACMHKVPVLTSERGSQWPEQWPLRVEKAPNWLKSSQVGVYGKAAPEDFTSDYEHWKTVVSSSYLKGMGIKWSSVRNVMDMKAVYGGFAAALKDLKVWVMNVVPINSPDTLPIIFERGLFGIYHDWCESFSTYPRSYDLVHADHLFSDLKKRCQLTAVIAEVDRILRPEGMLIVRDNVETVSEVESMAKSLQWEVRLTYSKDKEGLLCVKKTFWRPTETQTIKSAIA